MCFHPVWWAGWEPGWLRVLGQKVVLLHVLDLWSQTGMLVILKVLGAEPHPGLNSVCLLQRECGHTQCSARGEHHTKHSR